MSVPHNHAVPVFGCLSCISDERKGTIEKFLVEVPAPKCPKCSRSMEPYEEHTTTMTLGRIFIDRKELAEQRDR